MSRPKHYEDYDDIPEIVPGVFVDAGEAIYIVDDEGEVLCWVATEWEENPSAVTASINAALLAAMKGPAAVRRNLLKDSEHGHGQELEDLRQETAERVRKQSPESNNAQET